MPILQVTVSDVALTSFWYVRKKTTYTYHPDGSVAFCGVSATSTTASQESCARVFSLEGLPAGSVIHSASLDAVRSGDPGSPRSMDGSSASSGPVAVSPDRIIPGGSLEVPFLYRAATSASGGEGYHSGTMRWKQITLTIEYTGFTACVAPTDVAISKDQALPREEAMLSWSGAQAGMNSAIAGYAVYRAESEEGEYALLQTTARDVLSCAVTAPSQPGSYHYRVKALSSESGYDSPLSAVSASLAVSATKPGKPASLAVSPARQYPEGEAALSWAAAEGGDNNPVTGYAVYCSAAAEGPYQFLKNAGQCQCAVTAPQSGVRFFKVLAVGQCLQGELSDDCASLAADLSGTSDFSLSLSRVDAGEELVITPVGCLDRAHTLTVSIGEFSATVEAAAGAASLSFTPPLAWLSAMPNADTGEMTLKMKTQGGGTIIKTALLRCPDGVAPAGMNGSVTPISTVVPSAWNTFVSGFSAANAVFSTAGQALYGASIVEYRLEGPGVSLAGPALPLSGSTPILTAGEKQFILSATDTRGRTGKTVLPITVYPYDPPALSDLLSVRALSDGTEDDEGTYIRCSARVIHSDCGSHSTARCAVFYRLQGQTAWQSAGEMANGLLLFGAGQITLPDNWEIRCAVTDDLGGEQVYYDVVTRAQWEMHVKKGGGAWAFGGVADTDGALKVYGRVIADGFISSDGSSPAAADGQWTPTLAYGDSGIFSFSNGKWRALGRNVTVTLDWRAAASHADGPWTISGLPFVWDQNAAGIIANTASGRVGLAWGDAGSSSIRLYFISGQAGPPSYGHSGIVSISGLCRSAPT